MINIEERKSSKVVGDTSLFISFNYNQEIIDYIKYKCSGSNYSKKTKEWEIPIIYLSGFLDNSCLLDDINLKLLDYIPESNPITYKLKDYKIKPFDYQEEGIQYGLNHPNFLLLDCPGLGKTAQLIHIAEELKDKNLISNCLIICGVNTLKENWGKEIEKHSDLTYKILGKKISKKGRISYGSLSERINELKKPLETFFLIANIESLRSNELLEEIINGVNNFDMIIFDEIHKSVNPTSQQGANTLKLSPHSKYKIGATGTLLLNNPIDAYIPLTFIGANRATYTNFKNLFCNYNNFNMIVGFKNTSLLKSIIKKNSLRRDKSLLNLPPKIRVDEYVEMNSAQNNLYEDVVNNIKEDIDKINLNTTNLLSKIARLRQVTACPSVLTSKEVISSKVERACDLTQQIISNGDKVVIFSTFKQTVEDLKNALKEFNPLIGTGDTPDAELSDNIDKFQTEDKYKVFIGTHSKMGTGVTLTAASYLIFIDTPYTFALLEQAEDRIYRIGTKKSVTIYNLITKDTVDERVAEIVNDKKAISDYIVDDKITKKGLDSLRKYIESL